MLVANVKINKFQQLNTNTLNALHKTTTHPVTMFNRSLRNACWMSCHEASLPLAIIDRAARDAIGGSREAHSFFYDKRGEAICDLLDLDYHYMQYQYERLRKVIEIKKMMRRSKLIE